MLGNTFGRLFRVTTVGESYGIGKGSGLAVIIDGVPPGLALSDKLIQEEMDKRRPGVGQLNSPGQETDQCHIFAGLGQEGLTTGAPVGIIVYNVDTQPIHIEQYREYKDLCRPGHATHCFYKKYGEYQDWCGVGRSSGRETVGRVAGGAVAKIILAREGIDLIAYTSECMGIKAQEMTHEEARKHYRENEINCPDAKAAEKVAKDTEAATKANEAQAAADAANRNAKGSGLGMLGTGVFFVAVGTAEHDSGQISVSNNEWGVRTTDTRILGTLTEFKTADTLLNRVVHCAQYGCYTGNLTGPIYGGWCGGAEGVAVALIAYSLNGRSIYGAIFNQHFPFHLNWGIEYDPRIALAHCRRRPGFRPKQ